MVIAWILENRHLEKAFKIGVLWLVGSKFIVLEYAN